jgi:HEAT repeat protein
MRHDIRNHQRRSRLLILIGFTLSLTLVVGGMLGLNAGNAGGGASAQELGKLNRFIQNSNAKDEAVKIFRQGRDQIEDENWSGAAATFNSFVVDYPKHKDVDAALYWMAFALKKREKYSEADRQLERLVREHPRSNWLDDARAMRVEIAGQTGNSQAVERELDKNDIEIKLIALQGLFQSNPDRAMAIVAEILLKPDSQAGRQLKDSAIALMGQHSGPKTTPKLMELARALTDRKLRKTAIFWLGQSGDESALDLLKELSMQPADTEIAKAALFAISQHHSPRARAILSEAARSGGDIEARKQAIFGLSQRSDETSVEELIKIYDADTNTAIRNQVLFALTQTNSQRAWAKLLDVARTADDVEVRKQAIFWLGQQGGVQAFDTLAQLYDSENNNSVKQQLIFAFSQSRHKAALRKLMQIAKSDSSVEMRKKAIFWLGQSHDPEAVKFIEEILK